MMQCAIFRGQNTIELQISCSFRVSSLICTKWCFYKFPTYQPYIAHGFLLAISRRCRHTVRQQYPFYRLLAMESQRNIRQTVHYHPAENNSALGIIKIGLLQAKFCWVLGKIQNLAKFSSGVRTVDTPSTEGLTFCNDV